MLDEFRRETLREIGNIGASHAANSLSQLLGVKVEIQVPELDTLPARKLQSLAGKDSPAIGVHSQLINDLSGTMVLLLPLKDGLNLARILTMEKHDMALEDEFTELEMSAIREVGNIMISSFASAMSDFLDFKIMLTPSVVVRGSLPSILGTIFEDASAKAILFTTAFKASSQQVRGHLILLPDPGASDKIFAAIKNKYGLG